MILEVRDWHSYQAEEWMIMLGHVPHGFQMLRLTSTLQGFVHICESCGSKY
jgi:hypothetical protein